MLDSWYFFAPCSNISFLFFTAESLSCSVCWINIDLPFAIKQMTDQEIGWRLKVFQADSDWLSLLRKYRWRIDLRCRRRWILKNVGKCKQEVISLELADLKLGEKYFSKSSYWYHGESAASPLCNCSGSSAAPGCSWSISHSCCG